MGMFKYALRVASGMRFKKLGQCIDRVHEKCGKNKAATFFDMMWCAARYGAGYYDYLIFGFYAMNAKQRDTYVTRMRNKKLITRLNNQAHSYLFENKGEFDKLFADFLGRDVIDVDGMTREAFAAFMADKETVFCKPYSGESGKGIEKLNKSDFSSLDAMFDYVTDGKFGLIEELIVQHPDLNRMYPNAINTYRIVTLVDDEGVAHCVYATAKFGAGGKFVDNLENGGICCPIDRETGRIMGCAHTSRLVTFDEHPDTHVTLMGYQLPMVQEAIDLCLKAAKVVPDMRFIGWDAFVGEKGPGIVEGNDYPGYDFWQLPEHTPDKIGLWPWYKEHVPGLK